MDLKKEETKTLSTPKLKYSFLALLLFKTMDLVYGKSANLSKFKVLEIIARVPYQAWENVAYIAITHKHNTPGFAKRIFDFVQESRRQQDNEQWHLFILEDLIQQKQLKESFFLTRIIPQCIAFFFYHISWILYVIQPRLSYRLNAEFEDHAEHEYMEYVSQHPDLEKEKYMGTFVKDYGEFETLADLFRQIAVDERHHKEESLDKILNPRFGPQPA